MDYVVRGIAIPGRSPQGERGLKSHRHWEQLLLLCRSPQGERGLKYQGRAGRLAEAPSLPARGAWIEIPGQLLLRPERRVAPRKGSVD